MSYKPSFNPLYSHDIFPIICTYLKDKLFRFDQMDDIQTLIQLEQLSKFHANLIRKHQWTHLIVPFRKDNYEYIMNSHNFKNIRLHTWEMSCYTALQLKNYNIYKLAVYRCSFMHDDITTYFDHIRILDLSYCKQLTDLSIKHLGNVHSLNLGFCSQLTDFSIKHLVTFIILIFMGCIKLLTIQSNV